MIGGVAMISKSTRWPRDLWAAIEIAAQKDDMTPAEIIRMSTLSYVAYMAARRGDPVTAGFDRLWEAARDLVRDYPL